MDTVTLKLLLESAIAGGIGIFIGLEREHSDGDAPVHNHSEDHLGVRTFTILALLGWICSVIGDHLPWLPAVGLLVAAGLVGAHYFRVGDRDLGLTTEVAAITTFTLGALVHYQRDVAVAVGLAVTLLLIAKPWFRRTIPKLRRVELTSTLQLVIVFAVVLPLLPVAAADPWGVLSPRRIGLFIVLIAGISYIGYIAHRLFGASGGAGLTGLVGGIASSTAVTVAMAQQSRADEHMVLPGRLSTFVANTVMFVRVLVVTTFVAPGVAATVAVPLGLMGLVTLAGAVWTALLLRHAGPDGGAPREVMALTNPFALLPALKWGIVLAAVLVAMAVAQQHFGDRGLYVAAAAAGLADVDAVTVAVSRQAQHGALDVMTARQAITIAVVSNTLVKGTIAVVMGPAAFGRPIALVFAAAIAAGIVATLAA